MGRDSQIAGSKPCFRQMDNRRENASIVAADEDEPR